MRVAGEGLVLVEGTNAAGWRIAGRLWSPPLLLSPAGVEALAPAVPEALLARALALRPRPELLLFGTGARLVWPAPALRQAAAAAGVPLEPMDSRAAARTWNLLVQEGRRIAALLT